MKYEELVRRINDKKVESEIKKKSIKDKYVAFAKIKKLTQEQRISRIEELLGIID